MNEFIQIIGLSLFGSVIGLIGGIAFLFNERLSEKLEEYSIPFSAGVLLTVALVGLLPEAVDIVGETAFAVTLFTFVGAYLFENVLFKLHHHEQGHHHDHDHDDHVSGKAIPLVIIGDTIHNFVDGVAIASSFIVMPGFGIITAISTFLHEVPHEISDFGIMLQAKWKRKDILFINILSALSTVLGALLVIFFLREGKEIGILLGVSAGLFLYLAATDFVPQIRQQGKPPIISVIPFLVGIIIMFVTLGLVPHSHEEAKQKQPEPQVHLGQNQDQTNKSY